MYFSALSKECDSSLWILSPEIELELHNQSTQRHCIPCSSTCMWQGTGIYALLLPVLLSLNLSFCLFSHSCSTKAFSFHLICTKSCSKYFRNPFWSHELMLTHFIVCGSGPHGEFVNGRLAQPALFPLSWTCSTHSSLPQLTLQSWLRYNLSAGVVTLFFFPTRPPKEVGVISCRSCL